MDVSRIRSLIRDVPDFPQTGIVFKDITPVLADVAAVEEIVQKLARFVKDSGADVVAGIESRGFIIGTPVAVACRLPFVPIRKAGKLPYTTVREEYELEYGAATIEAHIDAVQPGQRVVIMDDLLATGGTAAASVRLMERLGGVVCGLAFVVELGFLRGRDALPGLDICTLVRYD